MAQQTAVEWLIEQLVELDKQLDGRRKSGDSTVVKLDPTKIYEQAKQMEREQIVNAFDCDGSPQPGEKWISNGEQYYNETYSQ